VRHICDICEFDDHRGQGILVAHGVVGPRPVVLLADEPGRIAGAVSTGDRLSTNKYFVFIEVFVRG
jgi:hypothetical protein